MHNRVTHSVASSDYDHLDSEDYESEIPDGASQHPPPLSYLNFAEYVHEGSTIPDIYLDVDFNSDEPIPAGPISSQGPKSPPTKSPPSHIAPARVMKSPPILKAAPVPWKAAPKTTYAIVVKAQLYRDSHGFDTASNRAPAWAPICGRLYCPTCGSA